MTTRIPLAGLAPRLATALAGPLMGALVGALGLALALTAQPAAAQTQAVPSGRLLASNCFQCHGTHGKGPGFDRLAGKSASKIYQELQEFRAGGEGNGIMARHALGYTDAQLLALSNYLASVR